MLICYELPHTESSLRTSIQFSFSFSTTSGFAVYSWVFWIKFLPVQLANRGSGWERWCWGRKVWVV